MSVAAPATVGKKDNNLTLDKIKALRQRELNKDQRSREKGKNESHYWKIDGPSTNSLSGPRGQHARGPKRGSTEADPFIYFPTFRVAGLASKILKALQAAGVNQIEVGELYESTRGARGDAPGVVQLTIDSLVRNSWNPGYDLEVDELLKQTFSKPKGGHKVYNINLADWSIIAQGISKKAKKKVAGEKTPGTPGGRGKHSRSGTIAGWIDTFDKGMDALLSGATLTKVQRINKNYLNNETNLRGINLTDPPKNPTRAKSIRPIIRLNGRDIAVPVIANPEHEEMFADFMQVLATGSRYREAIPQIIEVFHNAAAGRQMSTAVATPIVLAGQPLSRPSSVMAPVGYTPGASLSGLGQPTGGLSMPARVSSGVSAAPAPAPRVSSGLSATPAPAPRVSSGLGTAPVVPPLSRVSPGSSGLSPAGSGLSPTAELPPTSGLPPKGAGLTFGAPKGGLGLGKTTAGLGGGLGSKMPSSPKGGLGGMPTFKKSPTPSAQ